ncbi:hypothetical protein, partial [Gordonia sp. HS-NH1]|uniref:hypothetical protein n=1 Tax=Gordonia sp. HS-NH1 TaxID=1435068 RepID=UPI001E4C3636
STPPPNALSDGCNLAIEGYQIGITENGREATPTIQSIVKYGQSGTTENRKTAIVKDGPY